MTRTALCKQALSLYRGGMSYDDISAELAGHYTGTMPEPSRGWAAGLVRDGRKNGSDPTHATEGADRATNRSSLSQESGESTSGLSVQDDVTFHGADHKRAIMQRYLKSTWEAKRIYVSAPVETRTVAGIGDLHGMPDETVAAALIECQPDVIIVGGDTTDQPYASRHVSETKDEHKARMHASQRDELATMRAWFELLQDETAAEFHILLGNHDQWSLKAAANALPAWMVEHYPEPLDLLLAGFDEQRVKRVAVQVIITHGNGTKQDIDKKHEFIYVYGDALFSHLNKCQSAAESGVSKVFRQWFTQWDRSMGLDNIRVIVHFHVHARTMLTRKGGHLLLIEPGMGGSVAAEDYKFSYQGKWGPSVQGFVKLTQYFEDDRWLTDLDSVELIAPRLARRM